MKANFIDRVVGYLAPSAGYARLRSRAAMSLMQHYDAAGGGRRTQGWRTATGDGNAAARSAPRIRELSRDMVRNNAIAARAVALVVNNIVGDGIIPTIEADSDRDQKILQDAMLAHVDSTSIDVTGRTNLYGLQRQAVTSMVVGGEAIMRRRLRRPGDGVAKLPFQVEVMEGDQIDSSELVRVGSSGVIADGIEMDNLRRRLAYRLFLDHPGDPASGLSKSMWVSAENVIHLYRVDRAGQRRGVPWLAPVVPLMQDAYEYADAQLVRQKIAAMWVAFTRDIEGDPSGEINDYSPEMVPGMIENLPSGREIQFSTPPKVEGYAEHMKQILRMVAASLDLTYEDLSGDLEGVNFSSGRMGRLPMRRAVEAAQWTLIIPALCEPFGNWIRSALRDQASIPRIDDRSYRIKWTPPPVPVADPKLEAQAAEMRIQSGLSSRQREIREMGYDPEDVYREIAEDAKSNRAMGIPSGAASEENEMEFTRDGT
ncbi:MAG: phage portal protein [Roseovarius sp.]|nr:phage portal protein [Roseovarius sp.]